MSIRLDEVGEPRKTASDTDLTKKGKDVLPGAMEAGVKVKMPVGLLGHVTRAQSTLESLRKTGGVEGVVWEAFRKYSSELQRLKEACDAVKPADEVQRAAKEAWIERNIQSKEKYLAAMQEVFGEQHPKLQLNSEDLQEMRSARSGPPSVISTTSSRRQAAAQTRVLELEKEHQNKQRLLEDQERRLRQQREDEELELKLQQARIMEEAAGNEGGSQRAGSVCEHPREEEEPPEAAYLPPVSTWAPRSRGPRGPMASQAPITAGNPTFNATEGLLQQVLLPQSTLPVFKGEPLDFMWFIRAFEMRVEAVTMDPARRLHLLIQHLEGDAKTLVMGCQLDDDPSEGYRRAKHKLMFKYGNKVRQALAFKAKLLAWPTLRKDSVQDLERFSVQLQLCGEVKLTGGLAELDAGGTLVQLMHKLPPKMQESWQMRAHKIESSQYRAANFDDFNRFVGDIAAARTHPVYGKMERKTEAKRPAKALATVTMDSEVSPPAADEATCMSTATDSVNAFDAPCLFCEGNHATEKCRKSASMTLRERRRKLGRLCFSCLQDGHSARQCPKKAVCSKCGKEHPTVLHMELTKTSNGEKKDGASTSTEASKPAATACATASPARIAVAVLPVKIWCKDVSKALIVKAVLDPGSTATFVTTRLAKRMGLEPKDSSLKLTTMTACDEDVVTQVVSGVRITGMEQTETLTLPPMYTVDQMPYTKEDVTKAGDVLPWEHLSNIPFSWCPEAEVELLIGMNAPDALRPLQVVSGGSKEPYAVRTALGWSMNGPIGRSGVEKELAATVNLVKAREIQTLLEKLHHTDFTGAHEFGTKGPSQEDRQWVNMVENSITRSVDDPARYQIALPFRKRPPPLRDNETQALKQLNSLRRKFQANAQFRSDYTAFMKGMQEHNYVEEVDPEEETEVTSYVPHHGVYHPHKPGKIRVVFNCSSKFEGCSLNDCLIPGPDLTSSLVGVLLRFRQERVAFIADVAAMFYQVHVPPCDRNALRYLWWPWGEERPKAFRMKVHLFGAASSPSCANFALRRAADDALASGVVQDDVCQAVKRNFYVDDCLKCMPTTEEAIRMATGLVKACATGGFRLTKFVATDMSVLRAMPESEWAKDLQNVDLREDKHDPLGALQERALGVLWDIKQDAFKIRACLPKTRNTTTTKRSVLSMLSSVYDPLGLAAPVIVVARVLFRDLTRNQEIGWDDSLERLPEIARKWANWVRSLPDLHAVAVPRCYKVQPQTGQHGTWQLHVFCDASEDAYAAVAYLRWQDKRLEDGETNVVFVMGKARVTPPKVVTIPRLELTAAKLATEVATLVQTELQYKVEQRVFWTDSQTVLKYLGNTVRRFHTFVANRVTAILDSSNLEEWRHVPTACNPADEGTRGLKAEALATSSWLEGPPFLRRAPKHWPQPMKQEEIEPSDPEVRTLATKVEPQSCFIEELAQRHSTFYRLKAAVMTWRRFIAHVSNRVQPPKSRWEDLCEAENAATRAVQGHQWPEELQLVREGKSLPKRSPLSKLSTALLDNGTIVMRSRTGRQLPILPGRTRLAELVVREAHVKQAHCGRQATAAQVLKAYWVVGLGAVVKKVINECPTCQRLRSQPRPPEMAVLPDYRTHTESGHAFETAGVDYFGPFTIKKARTTTKMYGVIFTCAAMRAVHLEVAEDLSTSAFLNALRRFIARRGHVKRLVSDNGTNFVGAEATMAQELKREMAAQRKQSVPITRYLEQRGIEWRFNPPGASHHGGFWERLIRSVRRVLSMLMPEQRPLTYDGLATMLCETEAILNNRPLTSISSDPNDYEALTPNHLLLGREGPVAPPGDFKRSTIPLKRQWRQVQHLATSFWRRWVKEYQVLLHQRSKWHQDEGRNLELDDVVLVLDSVKPREYWSLGRVIELHPGKDGKVRVVTIKTSKAVLKRPVTKLCLLEVASDSNKGRV